MKLPISACIIVKNEEKNLPLLLESIKGLFQEIIITDTGSIDKTKEIASNYTKNIYDFIWVDDFSKARNFCLSQATQEWILCLDADFVFLEKSIIEIQKTIQNPNYQIFNINCIEFDGLTHPLSFLFKNHLGIEFIGSIHEQLSYTKTLKKGDSEIYVSHNGYLNEKIRVEKSNRNRKIIDKELLNNNNLLNELRLKIYQFYNEIETNTLNKKEIILKLKELDEKINTLTDEEFQSRKQLFESFYIFSFNLLNIEIEEKINLLKKLLMIFTTSLNLLYLLAEVLFEVNPYKSIKILYLAYYMVKSKDFSLHHYATKDNLKNQDYLFSEILKKYEILGDYQALDFWKKKSYSTTECMEQSRVIPSINYDFIATSIFEYLKIAREFCYFNIYPDKALFFYDKLINTTSNENLKNICYTELLLNCDFLELAEAKITSLIKKLTDLDAKTAYTHYCLAKYYKKHNFIPEALENFEQAFLMELEDIEGFFDEINDKDFSSIILKNANNSSYEYLRIIEELNLLSEEGFL